MDTKRKETFSEQEINETFQKVKKAVEDLNRENGISESLMNMPNFKQPDCEDTWTTTSATSTFSSPDYYPNKT